MAGKCTYNHKPNIRNTINTHTIKTTLIIISGITITLISVRQMKISKTPKLDIRNNNKFSITFTRILEINNGHTLQKKT